MTTPDTEHKGSLAERVIGRITAEHVEPRPRWEFLFENYFFWTLGAVAVVLGAFAFSAIIFELTNADWQYAFITHSDMLSFLLDAAPFIWVATLVLFVGVGYLNVRRTKHGYRYPLSVIAVGAVLMSLALGSALYVRGFGGILEQTAGMTPLFNSIVEKQRTWWVAPERGLLGGTIVKSVADVSSFTLRDWRGDLWNVDATDLRPHDLVTVARGGLVHVVGVPTAATSSFHACFVFPWEIYGEPRSGPPPFPVAFIASTSDRSATTSDACAHTRPYQKLRMLDDQDDF